MCVFFFFFFICIYYINLHDSQKCCFTKRIASSPSTATKFWLSSVFFSSPHHPNGHSILIASCFGYPSHLSLTSAVARMVLVPILDMLSVTYVTDRTFRSYRPPCFCKTCSTIGHYIPKHSIIKKDSSFPRMVPFKGVTKQPMESGKLRTFTISVLILAASPIVSMCT